MLAGGAGGGGGTRHFLGTEKCSVVGGRSLALGKEGEKVKVVK